MQEERDMLLGRMFGSQAIVESKILQRDHVSAEQVKKPVKLLVDGSNAKSYVKEACFNVIIQILLHLRQTPLRYKFLIHFCNEFFFF